MICTTHERMLFCARGAPPYSIAVGMEFRKTARGEPIYPLAAARRTTRLVRRLDREGGWDEPFGHCRVYGPVGEHGEPIALCNELIYRALGGVSDDPRRKPSLAILMSLGVSEYFARGKALHGSSRGGRRHGEN